MGSVSQRVRIICQLVSSRRRLSSILRAQVCCNREAQGAHTFRGTFGSLLTPPVPALLASKGRDVSLQAAEGEDRDSPGNPAKFALNNECGAVSKADVPLKSLYTDVPFLEAGSAGSSRPVLRPRS